MRELVVQKDSSQALEQNDWKESKPLFGDGEIDAMKRRPQQKNPPSFYHSAVSPAYATTSFSLICERFALLCDHTNFSCCVPSHMSRFGA
jgi:hypothetical protein